MSITTQTDKSPQYSDSTIYTDVNALTNLKKQAREDQDEALPEVARQFESIFIGMMMKSMRQASLGDAMVSSSAIDTFRDMHDQQMSIELAKGKGFGLAESIVRQLRQDKKVTTEPEVNSDGSFTLPRRQNFYQDYTKTRKQILEIHNAADGNNLPANSNAVKNTIVDNTSAVKEDKKISTSESVSFSSAKEFVDKLWPMAEKAAEKLGVNAEVILSQAALETGWGQSIIKNSQTSSNNLFNIKADPRWNGEKIAKLSLEYENDTAVNKNSYFRMYDNLQDSFDDYVNFIKNNPRYESAIQKTNNPEQYLHEIHKAGYATDPKYVEKIMKVMNGSNIQGKLSSSS